MKLVKEIEEEKEQEEGADIGDGMQVEDGEVWALKPQKLDFADISETEMSDLDFDRNCSEQDGSTCDELNIVQEIQFSSQGTEDRAGNRSHDSLADMFSSPAYQ